MVIASYIVMIVVNVLANALPINGVTTGEVSDAYPNLFTPAPITFSIWGVIYLLLACYVIYQAILIYSKDSGISASKKELLQTVGFWFALSSAANAAWIISWHHYAIRLTMVFMIVILLSLIKINQELDQADLTPRESLLLKVPFQVYLAWITIATIANTAAFLVSTGWSGFGISEVYWTILVLGIGFVLSLITMFHYNSIAYGLVIIWAYTGILIKHLSKAGFDGRYPSIIVAVSICLVLLIIATLYLVRQKTKTA